MTDERRPAGLSPYVRHMLLCDDARAAPNNPRKVTVYGLLSTIDVAGAFPANFGFSVYLLLTEGRGDGRARIRIVNAETDQVCYQGPDYRLVFAGDPLKVYGMVIRIAQCEFPSQGLYW